MLLVVLAASAVFLQVSSVRLTHVSDCGASRGCWLLPSGCEGTGCTAMVTWKHQGRAMVVEMEHVMKVYDNGGWVALGISRDDRMGNDTVLECHFPAKGEGSVHLSHNAQNSNMLLPAATEMLLKDSFTEVADGKAVCGAEWILDITVLAPAEKKLLHTISSGKYRLMLATGDLDAEGEKRPHPMVGTGAPWKSAESVRFCHHCTSAFQIVDKSLARKF